MLKIEFIPRMTADVLCHEDLTNSERVLVIMLITLQHYKCYANGYTGGLQELADTLRWSIRTLKRTIADLSDKGYLESKRFRKYEGGVGVSLKVQEMALSESAKNGAESVNNGTFESTQNGTFESANNGTFIPIDKKEREENIENRGVERAHEANSVIWGAYGGWYEGKFRTMYVPTEEERVQCQQIATHIATMYERTFKTEPPPQQVADSLVKWMDTAYANANEWQRNHWSLRIIIKDFNQLNAKINERQSSTLGDAARSAIARYLNGCGSSGVDGQADKQ